MARKIATNLRELDATGFDLKYGLPGMTHSQPMSGIELYGHQVIPAFASLLAATMPPRIRPAS
ncbi:MAG TPA: hypothetical protein VN695_02680 [Streptosporangiaceae bacterium]|nr:hypothetical protein [Streptosporangiaceae bacterium]